MKDYHIDVFFGDSILLQIDSDRPFDGLADGSGADFDWGRFSLGSASLSQKDKQGMDFAFVLVDLIV